MMQLWYNNILGVALWTTIQKLKHTFHIQGNIHNVFFKS
jgi:hypothetical protein